MFIIPMNKRPASFITKDFLKSVILAQYIPRLLRIIPLYREVTRASGIFTETPWAGAAFNLLLYMLASHVSTIIVVQNDFFNLNCGVFLSRCFNLLLISKLALCVHIINIFRIHIVRPMFSYIVSRVETSLILFITSFLCFRIHFVFNWWTYICFLNLPCF